MTTLTHEAPTALHSNGHRPVGALLPPGRRNGTRIAFGVIVIVLCVLAAATLYSSADDRMSALAVRNEVPVGHEITAGDLQVVRVSSGSGVQSIAASRIDDIAGRIAAVTLVPGSLLTLGQVSEASPLPNGMAVAGATLAPGQYPVSLRAGDEVLLVETAATDASASAAPIERGRAMVLEVAESPDESARLAVSLVVPEGAATDIAGAGAAGRLSVVLVPGQ